ncbi:hypothetical protein, partial [Streptomyces sp. SID3343]|uniref:hypothetical protein n=1 Tax=Streptomyces sp. SID3343 TaxID=2690260 RepID=UPI00136B5E98
SLHHVWSIACAAGLIAVGRRAATSAPLVRALAGGQSPQALRAWVGMWEGVASGAIGEGPVVPASRHGDVTRELLRELYDHAGRWVPMGGLFELLSYAPDGRPRAPLGADPALFTGMLLAHRMDDLRAFGVLEIRELVGGGEPFMAVRLTPLGLYGLRARFLELGVPAPVAGPGGEVEPSLPPLYVPPRTECALAARMSPLLAQVAELAEYVEAHGPFPTSAKGVLKPDVARMVVDDLAIPEKPWRRGRAIRTARHLHALHRRWTLALGTGFLHLSDGWVHVADGLRVWREGTDAELVGLAARAMVVVAEDNATFGEVHDMRWDLPEGLAASLFTGLVQLGGPLPVSLFVGLAVCRDLEHVVGALPVEPPAEDEAFALSRVLDAPDLTREMGLLCGADGAIPPSSQAPADVLRRVRAGLILLADRLAALGVVRRTSEGITLTGLGGALVHRMFREQGLPVATVDDYTPTSGARLLTAMGGWPRPIATRAFAAWIEGRPVTEALSELCAAAGAAGPTERLMLFAHLGYSCLPDAAVEGALAEAAFDPTLAPHVWNWRLTHDHDVAPATLRTLAWLTADNAAAALHGRHESAVLGLLTEVTGSQGPGADVVFGELAAMGHPCAEDVLRFAEASHPDPKVARAAGRALDRLR